MAPATATFADFVAPAKLPSPALSAIPTTTRWSWACRVLPSLQSVHVTEFSARRPQAGDLALVEVESIGSHERITTRDNQRLRIYPGDFIVGVFGNRYATDAYEAVLQDHSNLSLLTAGGMIGTVLSRHRSIGKPTTLRLVGYLTGARGEILNLPKLAFTPTQPLNPVRNLIAVVGTGMNAGKTTSCVHLIKSLSSRGLKVAALKLTGSVSNRDQDEMKSAGAAKVIDFSDYGFPSTYLADKETILSIFNTIMADIEPLQPDVIVMEIADGVLQRETRFLLEDQTLRSQLSGVVLAADNALSARYGVSLLEQLEQRVIGVTGLITSSPLCMKEFTEICQVPLAPSAGPLGPIGDLACQALGLTRPAGA
ncbi:MAG: hypothetical protein NW208_04745 [Bryobacter sp.]|nr:hypothetical protein [Bryobacter sp.]